MGPVGTGYRLGPVMVTVGLALGAALFLAVRFVVVQQRVAAQEPPDERLSWLLLAKLAQRPVWLTGVGVAVAGVYLVAASSIVSSHLSHLRHRDHHRRPPPRPIEEHELPSRPGPRTR